MFWLIVQAQTAPVVFLAVCFGSLLCYKIHELWLSRITQLSWDFIVACTDSRWIRQLFATAIDVRNSNRNRSNSNQAHTYLLLNVESKTFSLQTKICYYFGHWSEVKDFGKVRLLKECTRPIHERYQLFFAMCECFVLVIHFCGPLFLQRHQSLQRIPVSQGPSTS